MLQNLPNIWSVYFLRNSDMQIQGNFILCKRVCFAFQGLEYIQLSCDVTFNELALANSLQSSVIYDDSSDEPT